MAAFPKPLNLFSWQKVRNIICLSPKLPKATTSAVKTRPKTFLKYSEISRTTLYIFSLSLPSFQVRGYPAWPARVESVDGKKVVVFFYGTYESATVKPDDVWPYNEETKARRERGTFFVSYG